MANATNLLNIDVNKLFEECSITEIDQVHKRLQAEVELKREELRTMVGERYRDLLNAADTIGEMKTTACYVIENVHNITTACRNLNDHQLIGFRSMGADQHQQVRKANNHKFYGVIVQIKLLTGLPEMIWSAIDDDDYSVATQLFIFSRHISTGLQLDSHSETMQKFPVAKKQWAVLSQFFFTIKQNCADCLEREDLTPEVAAKCLTSLLLLENGQVDHMLDLFVQMRLKAFNSVLFDDSRHEKVKDKILASIKLLLNTIELIYKCFIGDEQEEGLLMKELYSVTGENSQPTINLIKSEDPKMIQTLPDIISRFRPRVQINPLSAELVGKSCRHWLQNVERIATNKLTNLMNLVPTIKVLHDIKKLSKDIAGKPDNWVEICQKLSLPVSLDFYNLFYQPLINSRIKSIIQKSWSEIVKDTCADVFILLKSAPNDKTLKDLHQFVWSETLEDIPLNLKSVLDHSNPTSHKLLMKSRAFPLSLVEHVSSLDARVKVLSKGVRSFLETSSAGEKEQLVEYYSDCSVEGITQLITSIKSANYKQTTENYILLSRILITYKELCPSLKHCLTPLLLVQLETIAPWGNDNNLSDFENASDNRTDRWSRIAGLFDEESLRYWNQWLEEFVKKWPSLEKDIGFHTLLTEFPLWDTVSIEENDEQNKPVQSTIRVPALPSFPLQKLLHVVVSLLNSLVPHTIPKLIIVQIVNRINTYVHSHYEYLAMCEFVQKNQNCALQYYFDVKFVQLLFASREKRQPADSYSKLTSSFKSYIDPFDFDVFHPHVILNVKRAVQRMQQFFGVLLVNSEQLSSILVSGNTSAAGAGSKLGQDKNPNILALSSNSSSETWFPLLPIVTKETSTVGGATVEMIKTVQPSYGKE
ncbi:conserved oligomeric Golgi complex subunit 1 isoform X2 [Toxorhynchites rutilus septentrionalis]|uniref:conserved oligomeric Golgi complex subunit 1 isoform X2 n=1 Tax=Toxorhynchites rutilus septentrionalis TaxID=329112 RepID=UPI00247A3C7E|nr:conserved oligomeric Golgi complex subunit 1 isoform X2 [Toxorhynchites rutilus septentrionalis]